MSANDGGNAFPDGSTNEWGNANRGGMTLRDYFAANASDADVLDVIKEHFEASLHNVGRYEPLTRAAYRYMHADAMLAARSKS